MSESKKIQDLKGKIINSSLIPHDIKNKIYNTSAISNIFKNVYEAKIKDYSSTDINILNKMAKQIGKINLTGDILYLNIKEYITDENIRDSKYFDKILFNGLLNVFSINKVITPTETSIFDIEFKRKTNEKELDNLTKFIFDINKDFAKNKSFINIDYADMKNVEPNKIVKIGNDLKIDLFIIENLNTDKVLEIHSTKPFTIMTYNSSFKLKFVYEYKEKNNCPICQKCLEAPKCQACPEIKQQECTKCQACPETKKCPVCQSCPECPKPKPCAKCQECSTNFGWISATVILLLLSIVLFGLILFKKDQKSE